MAVDSLVDSSALDSALSSVADAIRAKGGTSGQLAFPAGFVSAVQAIPTGGGGGGLNGTFTPASNVLSVALSELVGKSYNHLLVRPVPHAFPGTSVRVLMFGYLDFETPYTFAAGTNTGGTAIGGYTVGNDTTRNQFKFNWTTGELTTQNASGSGYFAVNVTYEWMVW